MSESCFQWDRDMLRVAARLTLNRTCLLKAGTSVRPLSTEDPELGTGFREMTIKIPSRRLDTVLKRTSNVGTTALERALFRGLVRVNQDICKKKAYNVEPGDTLELWLAPVKDNPDLARVHSVEVVDYEVRPDNYHILVQVDKSLVVHNWRESEV